MSYLFLVKFSGIAEIEAPTREAAQAFFESDIEDLASHATIGWNVYTEDEYEARERAARKEADMPSPEACEDEFSRDLLEDRNGWKTVALANQATAQIHARRWAAAEALLMMALPHVEAEEDDSLAHEIRRHLNTNTKEQS